MTILTDGTGSPLAGWDPDEAAERIQAKAHARPEHAAWLAETDDEGRPLNQCDYCGRAGLTGSADQRNDDRRVT